MRDLHKIYENYNRDVYRYLMCLCQNTDLSEELTQETFYQAVKSINSYNGACKMSVWLCQIAKHSYYKYLEKSKHLRSNYVDLLDQAVSHETPEEEAVKNFEKIVLYRMIHSLDDPFKEILLLRILGDLSYKEIGEVLGKNENWARVNFYRGKIKLRERIESVEV